MDVQKFTDLCLWIFPISSDCTNCILPLTLHLAIFLSHSFVGVRCTCKTWGVHELSIGIGSILWKRRPLPSISAPSWHLLSTQKSSKVNTRKLKSPQTKAQKSHKKNSKVAQKKLFCQKSTKKRLKSQKNSSKVHKKKVQKSTKKAQKSTKKRLKSQKNSSKVHKKSAKVYEKSSKVQKDSKVKKQAQRSTKVQKSTKKDSKVKNKLK